METEHKIGRIRVGLDAILLIAMGLVVRWAVALSAMPEDWAAIVLRYAANAIIVLGWISLIAWLLISTWKALKKQRP